MALWNTLGITARKGCGSVIPHPVYLHTVRKDFMEPVSSAYVRPAFIAEPHDPGYGAFCDDDSVVLAAQHRRCADGVFRTLYKQTLKAKELKKTKRCIAQRVKALRLGRPVRRAKRVVNSNIPHTVR